MKTIILTFTLMCCCSLFAQQTQATIDTSSIEGQFEKIISESNRYQDFKVVKITKLNQLKNNTTSRISDLNTEITGLKNQIEKQKVALTNFEAQLETTNANLDTVNQEKGSISFLGMQLEKSVYNSIVWSIIGILLLTLGFFIVQFKNSNTQTEIAKDNLKSAENDLEDVRRKALEKEQRLGRQLQDERNKRNKPQHA